METTDMETMDAGATRPARGGRPSKITPANLDAVCAALGGGLTRRAAARWGGMSEDTLRRALGRPGVRERVEAAERAGRARRGGPLCARCGGALAPP